MSMPLAMADSRIACAEAVILIVWQIQLCSAGESPQLLLLEGSSRRREAFCTGEMARLKCIFPEGEQALLWYVSGFKRPFDAEYLSVDLPGHSAELSPEGNYSIVSIFKEEPYKANYSCAVDRFKQPDVVSNSVDVVFKDITIGGISATCKSNGSDSLTVAVNYVNECRRETVVKANGTTCSSVTKSPRMAVFQCDSLHPNTSYNITAVDSDGHVYSLSCMTANQKKNTFLSEMPIANMEKHTNFAYLALLGVCLPVVIGTGIVLYCYRKKRKHQFTPQDGAHKESAESLGSTTCHSTVLTSDENSPEDRIQRPYNDQEPEELLQCIGPMRSPSGDSAMSSDSTKPLLPQQQDGNAGLNYATLDLMSTAGTIKPPPAHETVSYAFIKPQDTSV